MRPGKSEFYAILLLSELKQHEYVSLSEVAEKYHVSQSFLYKIALKLRRAGVVSSKEGVDGGYMLQKESISFDDVLSSLHEGKAAYCACEDKSCMKHSVCKTYGQLIDEYHDKMKEIKLD